MSSKNINYCSKIPKFKNGSFFKQRNKEKNIHDLKYKKQNDSSYMQLNITKVYFLKKRKKIVQSQENLEESVTDLANKISALCNKIKDVESCVFLGRNFPNTQLEFKATGEVDIVTNCHIKKETQALTDDKNSSREFCLCELETKRHRNCFNINESTSELFCPNEFSFENMLNQTSKPEKSNPELVKSEKWHLKFVLEELSHRTEEIMKRIHNIDLQIKQIYLLRDFQSINGNCQYSKIIFEELSEQKKEISKIVHSLKECINKIPGQFQYQKQIQMLMASFNTIIEKANIERLSTQDTFPFKNLFIDDTALHCVHQQNKNITESKSEGKTNSVKHRTKICCSPNSFFNETIEGEKISNTPWINKARVNIHDLEPCNSERGITNEIYRRSLHNFFENETLTNCYSNNVPEKDTNNIEKENEQITKVAWNKSFIINPSPLLTDEKFLECFAGGTKDLSNFNQNVGNRNSNTSVKISENNIKKKSLNQVIKSSKPTNGGNQKNTKQVNYKSLDLQNADSIEANNRVEQILVDGNCLTSTTRSKFISSECGDHNNQLKSFPNKSLPTLKENDYHCFKPKSKNTLTLYKDNDQTRESKTDVKCTKLHTGINIDDKIKVSLKQKMPKLDDEKIHKLRSMLQMNARDNQVKDNLNARKDKESMLTDDKKIEKKNSEDVQITSTVNNELLKCHFADKSCQFDSVQCLLKNKSTKISRMQLQNNIFNSSNNNSFDLNNLLSNVEELLKNEVKLKKESRKTEPTLLSWKNKSLNSSSCTSDTTVTDKNFDAPNITRNKIKNDSPSNINNKFSNFGNQPQVLLKTNRKKSNQFLDSDLSKQPFTKDKCLFKSRRNIRVLSKLKIKRKEYTGISKQMKSYNILLRQIKHLPSSASSLNHGNVTIGNCSPDILFENENDSQFQNSNFHTDATLKSLDALVQLCFGNDLENVQNNESKQKDQVKVPIDEPTCIKQDTRMMKSKNSLFFKKTKSTNNVSLETRNLKASVTIDGPKSVCNDKNKSPKRQSKYVLCLFHNSSDLSKLKPLGYKPIIVNRGGKNGKYLSFAKFLKSKKNKVYKISNDILETMRNVNSREKSKSQEISDLKDLKMSNNSFCVEPIEIELDRIMNAAMAEKVVEEKEKGEVYSTPQPELGKIISTLRRILPINK